MNMSDTDQQLLARYARHHAEGAFAEIVCRHLDLVHFAALRQVRSPELAEEVAQASFLDLARQADRLPPDTVVPAWLDQVTRSTAIDAELCDGLAIHQRQPAQPSCGSMPGSSPRRPERRKRPAREHRREARDQPGQQDVVVYFAPPKFGFPGATWLQRFRTNGAPKNADEIVLYSLSDFRDRGDY